MKLDEISERYYF